jgi:Lon protease-like protein
MTAKGYKTANVQMPEELYKQAEDRGEAEDRTISNLMRVALRYYLEHTEP